MEPTPSWPRKTDDDPGKREREISELLASGGAKVLQTGEARKMTRLDSEDFAELPPQLLALMQSLADRANTYLAGPIIQDNFSDHDDRREWKNGASQAYGEEAAAYLHSNRMSGNKITELVTPAAMIDRQFKKLDTPLSSAATEARRCIGKLMELFEGNKFPMIYGQATSEGKIDIVRLLSVRLRDYLKSVS